MWGKRSQIYMILVMQAIAKVNLFHLRVGRQTKSLRSRVLKALKNHSAVIGL